MNNLQEVQEFLDKIPNINRGGCGISAISMYRWLKKNKGIKSKFIFLYGDDFVGRFISELNYICVQEGNLKDMDGPYHIMLLVDNKIIDSSGEDISYELVQDLNIDEEIMITLLENNKINPEFNWKKWLPIIEFELEIQLNDLNIH